MLFFIVEWLNYVDSIAVKAMNKHKITIRNKVIIVLITFQQILQCKYKSKRISLYKSYGICMFSLTWWTVFLRWKCSIHRPVYVSSSNFNALKWIHVKRQMFNLYRRSVFYHEKGFSNSLIYPWIPLSYSSSYRKSLGPMRSRYPENVSSC